VRRIAIRRHLDMTKTHSAAVAALLAVAVILGSVAVFRTTALGTSARQANDAAVAAKTRQLAAYQRSLAKALAAKTPALPKLPTGRAAPATATPQQRVVYHRPPPVVVVKHTAHGDDGYEAQGGGGDD
jgi:hypothetical protein